MMARLWRRLRSGSAGAHAGRHTEPRLGRWLPFLALILVCLPAVQPLLRGEISCGYDNAFHLYRAVQIDHLWDQGVLFSRWAPDMAHGFGFPLFVFGPPLAQGLLALVHRLGIAWPVGMNLVFLIGVALGGFFMFHLAKTLYGVYGGGSRAAGLAGGAVATVAYVYAPFLAYDIYNRGSLWESFAWAFPPLVLLGMHRWSLDRDRRYLIAGVAALAAMIMTHYPFAFLFAPVFVLWALVQGYLRRSWAVVGRAALLGVLGLGVTAFFWVPALLERSLIQTGRLLGTWVFDYHHNFLPLSHLLALPRRADPALINDWPEKSLGLVPLLVALLPAVGRRDLDRQRRRQMWWQLGTLWMLVAGLSALTLPVSLWVWEHVPLLAFVQFPWRYLGPAAFCLALLAGAVPGVFSALRARPEPPAPTGSRRSPRFLGWATAALICALVVGNLGWFYPSSCSVPGDLTVEGIIRWERLTDTLGTTAKGEYLPIWVERFPDVTLDDQYAAGGEIVRLRPEDLPAGGTISRATYGALRAEIALETPEPFTARYLAFYYPGWRVTVDGVSVPVAPEAETGLVTFDVPAGAHVIEVAFGETPLRWAGDGVTLVSLVLLLVVLMRSGKAPASSSPEASEDASGESSGSRRVAVRLLGAATVLIAVKVLVVDGLGVLWRSSRWDGADVVAGAAVPLTANFGNRAMFLGVEELPQGMNSEVTPVLTLYWRALAPGGEDWQVGLTLVGPDGSRRPVGIRPARWARTPGPLSEWPRDGYARMDTLLDLVPGMAPGIYRLELALFDRATAEPASVLDAAGNPIAPALVLGDVSVVPPKVPPSLHSLDVDAGAEMQPCGPVGLWSARLNRSKAAPGDSVVLTTVWESLAHTEDNLTAEAVLLSGTGDAVASWAFAPAAAWWPTSLWEPGRRQLGTHDLRLPGSLASGTHTLQLNLGDCDLGSWRIDVEAPERTWELPEGFSAVDEVLGDEIRLAGYRGLLGAVSPGETLDLVLGWEALREIMTAYRVFVHVVDDQGHLLAQNDGEPTGWTRPTTGWAVGEVVIDPRPLQIPETAAPGSVEIRVGVYAPDGQRLLLADGADSILLGRVEVGE